MRYNGAVVTLFFVAGLAGCGGSAEEEGADRSSQQAPPPRPSMPAARPANDPFLELRVSDKRCSTNADCAVVPVGNVCTGWSFDAISTAHASDHRASWRAAAAKCRDLGNANNVGDAFALPAEIDARCPG